MYNDFDTVGYVAIVYVLDFRLCNNFDAVCCTTIFLVHDFDAVGIAIVMKVLDFQLTERERGDTDRQTDRHTDRQTHRHTDRKKEERETVTRKL